jgi:hypothetical protein
MQIGAECGGLEGRGKQNKTLLLRRYTGLAGRGEEQERAVALRLNLIPRLRQRAKRREARVQLWLAVHVPLISGGRESCLLYP